MGVLTKDIDSRPYTGKRTVKGRLRLSEKPSLDVFFGGNPDVVPITGARYTKSSPLKVSVMGRMSRLLTTTGIYSALVTFSLKR